MSCIKLDSDSDVGGGGGGGGKLSLWFEPDLEPLDGERACSGGGAGGGCDGLEGDPTALVGLSCSSEASGAAAVGSTPGAVAAGLTLEDRDV